MDLGFGTNAFNGYSSSVQVDPGPVYNSFSEPEPDIAPCMDRAPGLSYNRSPKPDSDGHLASFSGKTSDTGYYSYSDASLSQITERTLAPSYTPHLEYHTAPGYRSYLETNQGTNPYSWTMERTPSMQGRNYDEPQAPYKPREFVSTRTQEECLESKKELFKKPDGAIRYLEFNSSFNMQLA